VRFGVGDTGAVPILVSVTAVTKKDPQAADAERARAQALLAQAQAALAAGQEPEARELFGQAVAADARLWPAWEKLADLAERGGNDDAKLAVYRQWAEAGAVSPVPYNRLGELLERRKEYPGALEAYRRSLEVEWNQPPVIEAVRRLEKAPSL